MADHFPMSLTVGAKLGPYEIIAPLGAGGMGEVYRARDLRLDREVALKLLPPHGDRSRFQAEAKAVAALSHPNIVAIFDVGENYLVTELVDGHPFPVPTTPLRRLLDLAVQIADGLAAAHAAGFIHRDLKPANILLSRDGRAKILDFGLAKRVGGLQSDSNQTQTATQAGVVVGTVAYMSPEQARGVALDIRSDQFSFGLVLYEMITGKRPFVRQTAPETMTAILREQAEPLPADVPPPLRWIVERCLAKEPADRYDTTRGLYLELRNLRDHMAEVSTGSTPVASTQAVPVSSRKRWILPPTLAAMVLCGAAFWFGRTASSPGIPAETAPKLMPLITEPGLKSGPAFSPDGSRIAYVWKPDREEPGIFLRVISQTSAPVRLTTGGVNPVWSPDGRQLAFIRREPSRFSILLIDGAGGSERQVAHIAPLTYLFGILPLAWTADGKWLVAPDKPSTAGPFELTAISVQTGEKRRVTHPPSGVIGDLLPRVSPDGRNLAFLRVSAFSVADVFTQPMTFALNAVAEPKRLTSVGWSITALMWSGDSRNLLVAAEQGGSHRLWRVSPVQPGKPVPVTSLPSVGVQVATSAKGDRLVYIQTSLDIDIYRQDLPQAGEKPPPSVRLISSTRTEMNARISPDGSKIAFPSDRTGSWEIWVAASNGEHPVRLTSFGAGETGTPRWSADSRQIAFDARVRGNAEVYVVEASGGKPRPLVTGSADNFGPSWSHDGKWVYFISNRLGQEQVWKMPVAGGPAIQLTHGGAVCGFESTDGKWVYVTRAYEQPTSIWRVPADGGDEVKLVEGVGQPLTYEVIESGIYFLRRKSEESPAPGVMFYSFATQQLTRVADLDRPFSVGMSVSPDRRWIAFASPANSAVPASDVVLVENFR
uniref:Serine/threonine protein kinase n=1 Tax=Solibacter usitatus (strain Ellin6076) TaxID=234267 RepID=Q029X8_SOLUE